MASEELIDVGELRVATTSSREYTDEPQQPPPGGVAPALAGFSNSCPECFFLGFVFIWQHVQGPPNSHLQGFNKACTAVIRQIKSPSRSEVTYLSSRLL